MPCYSFLHLLPLHGPFPLPGFAVTPGHVFTSEASELGISGGKGHGTFVFPDLCYFPQYDLLVPSFTWKVPDFSFLYSRMTFRSVCVLRFSTQSSAEGHSGCFRFPAIENRAAVNMAVERLSNPWSTCQGMG